MGLLLCELGRDDLLPTILELIMVESQAMCEEYCVVGGEASAPEAG